MKNSTSKPAQQNTKLNSNKNRPENKDNLDSREGEEQSTKGDDITNNKKEVKSKKKG